MAASLEVRPMGKAREGGTWYANRIKSLEVTLGDLPKMSFLKLQRKYGRIMNNIEKSQTSTKLSTKNDVTLTISSSVVKGI